MSNPVLKEIVKSVERQASHLTRQNPLKFVKDIDVEEYITDVVSIVYLYTRPKKGKKNRVMAAFLVETVCAIGHHLNRRYGKPLNSSIAAKWGSLVLYSFEECGLLEVILGQGANGHASYIVRVKDEITLKELWEALPPHVITKLPSTSKYTDWDSYQHSTGIRLIKTECKEIKEIVNSTDLPYVMDNLNKSQDISWEINGWILDIQKWAITQENEAFSKIWEAHSKQAKVTKLREAETIISMAETLRHAANIHNLYYYDFRGRKYLNTTYLHEQGADSAKALLLRSEDQKEEIGAEGYKWLMISMAGTWAGNSGFPHKRKTDKISREERILWVKQNHSVLMGYGESPYTSTDWMKADKPWQFLALCRDYYLATERLAETGLFDHKSGVTCYIDGSNNGLQHLTALTRDDLTAPHVNLLSSSEPGDIYDTVATDLWNNMEELVSSFSANKQRKLNTLIDDLIELKKGVREVEPRSAMRKLMDSALKSFRHDNSVLIKEAAAVFWLRITDRKERRLIVKRNVMTLPYGGTPYGLGEQQIKDARKHNIRDLNFMEATWGAWLGRTLFQVCGSSIKRAMMLLKVLEEAGKVADVAGEFISWRVPITNFPVTQYYTEGITKKIWVQYGPRVGKTSTGYDRNTLQLNVCFLEDTRPMKNKQAAGLSPNLIHSLDAAHLALVCSTAPYSVVTVHDSYGAMPSQMDHLYTHVREQFVELYRVNPIHELAEQLGADLSFVDMGDYDVSNILESEYAFI